MAEKLPYPVELVQSWALRDGTRIVIRPIRPEDRQIEKDFVRHLSDESRYFRFFNALRDLSETALTRFTQVDCDREMALIAVICENGRETEIGVARYAVNPDGRSCEFAIVVADAWQREGIGSKLMNSLLEAARRRGLETMEGWVLSGNTRMLALTDGLGFTIDANAGDPSLRHVVKNLAMRTVPAGTAANPETT
ncbi:MAG TPA: GNAT family N-acetyltransferase [Burkholderiales bacterium]|nr:GNAT family N-acetyltransferase [Burkholderiales bacterium]